MQEEFRPPRGLGGHFFFQDHQLCTAPTPGGGAGAACKMYLGGRYAVSTGAAPDRSGVPIAPRSWNQNARLHLREGRSQ
jgi:hypothetical protein